MAEGTQSGSSHRMDLRDHSLHGSLVSYLGWLTAAGLPPAQRPGER